jgi:hypothetical protein
MMLSPNELQSLTIAAMIEQREDYLSIRLIALGAEGNATNVHAC